MSDSDMTVQSAVREINEGLSNAIPELMLRLVDLSEAHAPPPPDALMNIETVSLTAENLAQVCVSVADEDYAEFPEIGDDIREHANKAEDSANALRDAADALGQQKDPSDLEKGYRGVMTATKDIAASCIHVLEVVYGAYYRRVQQMNAAAKKALDDIDPDKPEYQEDLQAFADAISEAATEANKVAARLRELAEFEDSPLAKQEMLDAADKIEQRSDELIEAANQYLEDPENAEKKEGVRTAKQNLKDALRDASMPVDRRKNDLDQQAEATEKKNSAAEEAAKKQQEELRKKKEEAAQKALEEAKKAEEERIARELARPSLASQMPDADLTVSPPKTAQQVDEEWKRQEDLIDDFVACAESGRGPQMIEDARAILKRHPVLVAAAKEACPERVKDIEERDAALREQYPKLVAAGKASCAEADPSSTERVEKECDKALEKRAAKTKEMIEALSPEKLAEETRLEEEAKRAAQEEAERLAALAAPKAKPSRFESYHEEGVDLPKRKTEAASETMRNLRDVLDAMKKVARDESPAGQQELADRNADAQALKKHAVDEYSAVAKCVRDPNARAACEKDIADLADALARVDAATEKVLKAVAGKKSPEEIAAAEKELERALGDAQDAIESFEQDSREPYMLQEQRAKDHLDNLVAACRDHDATAVRNEGADVAKNVQRLADAMRDEASRCPDARRRAQLESGADELDGALSDMLLAAQKCAQDPNADPADAEKAAQALKKALDRADREFVNPARRVPDENALGSWACAENDADAAALDAASDAAAAAFRAADLNEELMEKNPEEFQKRAEQCADELDKIADGVRVSDEERLASEARDLAQKMQEMSNAKADGDDDFEELLLETEEGEQKLSEGLRSVCSALRRKDPAAADKLLEDAELLDQLEKASKEAQDADEMQRNAAAMQSVLKDVADTLCGTPQERVRDAEKSVEDDLKELREAVAAGDSERAADAARKLKEDMAELEKAADELARRDESLQQGGDDKEKTRAQKVLEAARKADSLAAEIKEDAKEWDKDGKNNPALADKKKKAINKKAAELENALRDMDKALDSEFLEAVSAEESAANDLMKASTAEHDAPKTVAAVKALAERQKALKAAKKPQGADEARCDEAIRNIDKLLPGVVKAAKDSMSNPSPETDKAMRDRLYEVENELAAARAAAHAGTKVGSAEDAIVAARNDIADLQKAAADGDAAASDKARESLRNHIAELEKMAEDPQSALGSGAADREAVDKSIAELRRLEKKLNEEVAPGDYATAASVAERMKNPLENLEDAIQPPSSEAEAAKRKIRGLAAKCRKAAVDMNKRGLGDLLKAGKELLDAMKALNGSSQALGSAHTKRGQALAALEELLGQIERGEAVTGDINKILDDMALGEASVLQEEAAEADTGASDVSSAVAEVATELSQAVEVYADSVAEMAGLDTTNMADFLKRMSKAAKAGNKPEMLVCAKGVRTCLKTFNKDLRSAAKRCKDLTMAEKMIVGANALESFGGSLSVIAMVKLNADESDHDADDQIVSVVRSLGKTTTEALDTIATAKKTRLLADK